MKRKLTVLCLALMGVAGLNAQGRGRAQGPPPASPPMSNPGSKHSNAPSGTPSASPDRDLGRDRAVDVGKGKHNGVTKPHKTKTSKKTKS